MYEYPLTSLMADFGAARDEGQSVPGPKAGAVARQFAAFVGIADPVTGFTGP